MGCESPLARRGRDRERIAASAPSRRIEGRRNPDVPEVRDRRSPPDELRWQRFPLLAESLRAGLSESPRASSKVLPPRRGERSSLAARTEVESWPQVSIVSGSTGAPFTWLPAAADAQESRSSCLPDLSPGAGRDGPCESREPRRRARIRRRTPVSPTPKSCLLRRARSTVLPLTEIPEELPRASLREAPRHLRARRSGALASGGAPTGPRGPGRSASRLRRGTSRSPSNASYRSKRAQPASVDYGQGSSCRGSGLQVGPGRWPQSERARTL